jgi:predicted transcriptional regulator of viral defense system
MMISFAQAVESALLADDQPSVSEYDLYRRAGEVRAAGSWDGRPIKHAPADWDARRFRNLLRGLSTRSAIAQDADFNSGIWRVIQSTRAGSAEEAACVADPFCYVSHLSAMQRYGLTERSPDALHITRPTRPLWNKMRDDKVAADPFADEEAAALFIRHGIGDTLRRRPVVIHETRYPATPVEIRGERTRISGIGRTFIDMLTHPDLCGGMRHVLDVWLRSAEAWTEEIIPAVEATASKIDKVRAGYILQEELGMTDPRIQAWQTFAQRGGSRKLDPEAPYAPSFSETWMISLNV